MGQIVRINQAGRFHDEFGALVLRAIGKSSLKPGTRLTFTGCELAGRDEDEAVMLHYRFTTDAGTVVLLSDDAPIFVPDDGPADYNAEIERLVESEWADWLGITNDELRAKMKRVYNEP